MKTIECEEFYNLMQSYRHADKGLFMPKEAKDAYKAVIDYIDAELNAHPAPIAVPLTSKQIDEALDSINSLYWDVSSGASEKFARAIEAAHGINVQPVRTRYYDMLDHGMSMCSLPYSPTTQLCAVTVASKFGDEIEIPEELK